MTRLQKKCLIAVAGTHLLVVVVLFCSGFIQSHQQVDDSTILTIIPDASSDQPEHSGTHEATPPPPVPPTPVVQPPTPTPPPPAPEPPKPIQPTEPPKPVEPVTPPDKLPPDDLKPVEHTEPKKLQPHKIDINLKPVVRKTPTENNNDETEAKAAAKRARDARERAIQSALHTIERHATSATTIEMPSGTSSVESASYAAIVKTVYTEAWRMPEKAASDEDNVKVSVTIARDGHVIEAHIVDRSGDSDVDQSVQNTLDRVTNIEPFSEDSHDKQRTFIINFNLKAKQMFG